MAEYRFRFSQRPADIARAQALRGRVFRKGVWDGDHHDDGALHGLVEAKGGALVCCFRVKPLAAHDVGDSYSAQFYDLDGLTEAGIKTLELGRFCVDPAYDDPLIIRLVWASLTNYVIENDIELMFGCSSFRGADYGRHADALALLRARHIAPKTWLPRIKAPRVFEFAKSLARHKFDLRAANQGMPPLLRSYLAMGGWVSDHAVVDDDLDTIHVFTGVEIKKIPPARRNLFLGLRANLAKTSL